MYHWHNVVHFSSFFFNILFLKWIPTGIEFPSWKLKWNWRALHIQNTVRFQMCFLLLTVLRTDFLWHHSEECVHHSWGYRIGEDPSQGTTTTKRKWAKENLLFVSASCHAQLVISRGSGQGLIWGQGWAGPTLIQVSRAIQEACSGPKLLLQPNSGGKVFGPKEGCSTPWAWAPQGGKEGRPCIASLSFSKHSGGYCQGILYSFLVGFFHSS